MIIQQHDGSTPIYWASYYGNSEVVQTLISKGAALNVQDEVTILQLQTNFFNSYVIERCDTTVTSGY